MRIVPALLSILFAIGVAVRLAETQRVINVPSEQPTVQAGIDAAGPGDTVIVAPGTYAENIDFKGKAISVRSAGGASVTTVHARSAGSVVVFRTDEGRRSVLAGFTLTGGSGTVVGAFHYGGGVYCDHASPTLADNVICDNRLPPSNGLGAGIACRSASPQIVGNAITDNTGYIGGGIYVDSSSAPEILHNRIAKNIAYASGGGVASVDSSPLLDGNRITENRTTIGAGLSGLRSSLSIRNTSIDSNESDGLAGGGVHLESSTAFFVNTIVRGNSAFLDAGAMLCAASTLRFTNCTILGNWVRIYTGGIVLADCDATFTNALLWGNGSTSDAIQLQLTGRTVARLSYSNLDFGRHYGMRVAANSTLVWGPGMIDADPKMSLDHIQWASACRDAGTVNAPGFPATDFEGDPRITGAAPDIGADEFRPWAHLVDYSNGPLELHVSGPPGSAVWWGWSTSTRRLDPPITVPGLSGQFVLMPPVAVIPLGRIPTSGVHLSQWKLPPNYPRPAVFAVQALVSTRFTRRFVSGLR